tara:strand:- start:3659 stop:4141 length:483 start_codon:yes stop_codon:yes gene_type:complete
MTLRDRALAQRIYLLLGILFVTSLVVSNLIFKKFFYFYPIETPVFGVKLFEISVGILPYPITFLITDLISEIYGKRKANEVVVGGVIASFFAMGIIYIAASVPATNWSPVTDGVFATVFGSTGVAFKILIAAIDTPFLYLGVFLFRKRFKLGVNEEIKIG